MNERQIEALKEIGSEWQKGEMHRIYFNGLAGWLGLKATRYNTGNISSATFNGEKISNSEARRIGQRLAFSKVYFDVTDGKFHGKEIGQEDFDTIVAAIKAQVA